MAKESGGALRPFLRTGFSRHKLVPRGSLALLMFTSTYPMSSGGWTLSFPTEDMDYLGCDDEIADLRVDLVSKKYFQKHGFRFG